MYVASNGIPVLSDDLIVQVKCPPPLPILTKFKMYRHILLKFSNLKFYKNGFSCSRVAWYSHKEGQTDRRKEATSKA